ncbi:MAG: hypothetical protein JRI23_08035 [Deltaproteobacteria bacterium]|jgi:hypothetical protein|nr:hypothetical protein [Deltaproteobacteria bacterium]MBW2531561.1 hypothetical protein [Deltaproteobacteria bacterium]
MEPTGSAQAPSTPSGDLAHPTELPQPPDPVGGSAGEDLTADLLMRDGLITVEQTAFEDEIWHFAVALADGCEVIPQPLVEPSAQERTQSLTLFRQAEPEADVEVLGHLLEHEIDPHDWLTRAVLNDEREIQSSKPQQLLCGKVGDVVATWTHEGEPFAGRFVATKWGPRLFVVCCRTRLGDYPKLAGQFLRTVASFQALDSSLGHFAERVHFVEAAAPSPWKVAIPESWYVQLHSAGDEGAWFDAMHQAISPTGEQSGDVDGRLSFAVMARSVAQRPRDAGNVLLRALADNEIDIEQADFANDDVLLPICRTTFSDAWSLVTKVRRDDAEGELRCRVLLHDHAWVVAGVMGPPVDVDDDAWMRNKRLLDLASSTLEIED